jgi:hypothetical protein
MGYDRRLTAKDYLGLLDNKLGFSQGTLYDMCVLTVKSKCEKKSGVTITYRGMITRQKRLARHRFVKVLKSVFLLEFKIIKDGIQHERVVQVQLEL